VSAAARTDAAGYLAQHSLRRTLSEARAQVERLGRVGGTVVLHELAADEASALSGLLAGLRRRHRPRPGRTFRLPLRDLDLALQQTRFGVSLPEALELAGPPLDFRPQRRAREQVAAARAWDAAWSHSLCRRDSSVRAWLESLREHGTWKRVAVEDGLRLLERALDLGERLPARTPMERTRLATEVSGDPHALDDDRPLSRLLLGQLAARAGIERPAVAVERRALWQRFGVTTDPTSANVLTLGLRPLPEGPLAHALLLLSGLHFRLTVGQLTTEALRFARSTDVFVCENPTVLTAAETLLGADCPPLICTDGWPSSAAWTLLEALAAADARLRYHGDFDWDGVRIARLLSDRFGALGWRFDAQSYRAGVERLPDRTRPLEGRPASAEADAALVAAMQEKRLELHEEAVLEDLLDDLSRSTRGM
jgi:uncharacterized protein (TIGR02679 family)